MGEQSTEAIHGHFDILYRTYGCMANKVEHLERALPECVSKYKCPKTTTNGVIVHQADVHRLDIKPNLKLYALIHVHF